jgi:ribosomal protein L21
MKKELQFRQSLFVRRQRRNHNRRPIEGASVAKVLQHQKEIKLSFSKKRKEKDTKREMVTDSFLLKL